MAKATEKTSEVNLKESLAQLNTIVKWFESQDEIDVEAGLEKVKEGAELVKICKGRLAEIENQFEQIKRDAEGDGSTPVRPMVATGPANESDESVSPEEIPF
jgi:exodeoxyribonuclease VII small subunit